MFCFVGIWGKKGQIHRKTNTSSADLQTYTANDLSKLSTDAGALAIYRWFINKVGPPRRVMHWTFPAVWKFSFKHCSLGIISTQWTLWRCKLYHVGNVDAKCNQYWLIPVVCIYIVLTNDIKQWTLDGLLSRMLGGYLPSLSKFPSLDRNLTTMSAWSLNLKTSSSNCFDSFDVFFQRFCWRVDVGSANLVFLGVSYASACITKSHAFQCCVGLRPEPYGASLRTPAKWMCPSRL